MPRLWNILITPRAVVEYGPQSPAKLELVHVRGLVCKRCADEAWRAMDTVPDHKVLHYNPADDRFMVTYRHAMDGAALDRAVQSVVTYRRVRWVLGLPMRLLGLPRKRRPTSLPDSLFP